MILYAESVVLFNAKVNCVLMKLINVVYSKKGFIKCLVCLNLKKHPDKYLEYCHVDMNEQTFKITNFQNH